MCGPEYDDRSPPECSDEAADEVDLGYLQPAL